MAAGAALLQEDDDDDDDDDGDDRRASVIPCISLNFFVRAQSVDNRSETYIEMKTEIVQRYEYC